MALWQLLYARMLAHRFIHIMPIARSYDHSPRALLPAKNGASFEEPENQVGTPEEQASTKISKSRFTIREIRLIPECLVQQNSMLVLANTCLKAKRTYVKRTVCESAITMSTLGKINYLLQYTLSSPS